MTTIAASRESMACDSRTSFESGEYFRCDDKIERIGASLIGCAGDVAMIFKFLAWFKNQEKERPEFDGDDDKKFEALVLNRDGIFYFYNSTFPQKVCEPTFAIGSGAMAAKAAMLCGKTPEEAVALAIKCDKHSGPPVRNYMLKE